MDFQAITRELIQQAETKIVMVVLDGLGGLPLNKEGKTELESASKTNLDALAADGVTGLITLILPGITPGSGPGHLALFGYDPLRYRIGRGVLEAVGIGYPMQRGDIAVRGNFCTVDGDGKITDRRAGRISSDECKRLVSLLRGIELKGARIFVEPVRDHRFVIIFRGDRLGEKVSDTDPQVIGVSPNELKASDEMSERTAEIVTRFLGRVKETLRNEVRANMVLLRGFSTLPEIPSMKDTYGLRSCALASYPMYRGLAQLVGMVPLGECHTFDDEVSLARKIWNDFDFFFMHYKATDTAGEDGDFDRKVAVIEEFDRIVPRLRELKPDVFVVTGDHSTPSKLKSHSWHPVPVILWASSCRPDPVKQFGETECLMGGLGQLPATSLMPLALAHAGRLRKFDG